MMFITGAYIAAASVGFCGAFWKDMDAMGDSAFRAKLKVCFPYFSLI
jgi:hypothetical protein